MNIKTSKGQRNNYCYSVIAALVKKVNQRNKWRVFLKKHQFSIESIIKHLNKDVYLLENLSENLCNFNKLSNENLSLDKRVGSYAIANHERYLFS